MEFEWDDEKDSLNVEKHGYSFKAARELFEGDRIECLDDRKDYGEPRFITMGYIKGRIVVAVYTKRADDTVRIISLRKANSREKERFESTRNRLDKD